MSNECSPMADRVVALHKTTNREAGGVAAAGPCATVRGGVSRAALYLAHINGHPQGLPPPQPVPERSEKSFWSSALDFLVEGFANCGTPLYPVAYLDAGGALIEADIPVREASAANERRRALFLVPNGVQRAEDGNHAVNVLAMAAQTFLESPYRNPTNRGPSSRGVADGTLTSSDALSPREIERPAPWNWLRSCWETVMSLHAHMRREREIRKAIDELAELDDFSLKDIGIHHRDQIEHAVRNSEP